MQHRRTLIGSVSCLILAAGAAQADVTTFTEDTNQNWSDPDNWDNGIPTEADRAVIPAGETCHVDIANAFADTIDVQASGASLGQLIINGNKKLTLDNDDGNADNKTLNSIVDGLLTLNGSGAVLDFVESDHSVSGDGEIHGTDDNARIEIGYDIKFTSRLGEPTFGITGAMEIKGLVSNAETDFGTFRNEGIVHANLQGDHVLKLSANTVLEDHSTTGTAKWMVSKDSLLEFNRDAITLKGNFDMACGEIVVKAHIRTCGAFVWDLGILTIDANELFAYGSYSTPGGCTNPQNVTPSVVDCTNWEVDDSNSPYRCGTCPDPI